MAFANQAISADICRRAVIDSKNVVLTKKENTYTECCGAVLGTTMITIAESPIATGTIQTTGTTTMGFGVSELLSKPHLYFYGNIKQLFKEAHGIFLCCFLKNQPNKKLSLKGLVIDMKVLLDSIVLALNLFSVKNKFEIT